MGLEPTPLKLAINSITSVFIKYFNKSSNVIIRQRLNFEFTSTRIMCRWHFISLSKNSQRIANQEISFEFASNVCQSGEEFIISNRMLSILHFSVRFRGADLSKTFSSPPSDISSQSRPHIHIWLELSHFNIVFVLPTKKNCSMESEIARRMEKER